MLMPYLYLVRHGQPDFAGNYDSLTDLGVQQSTWLGEHFAARGLQFARVAVRARCSGRCRPAT